MGINLTDVMIAEDKATIKSIVAEEIIDDLTSSDATKFLSAKQGKTLKDGLDLKAPLSQPELDKPTITSPIEKVIAMGANDIAVNTGSVFTKTITASTTFTVSGINMVSGNVNSFILQLTNGGSQTITWFSGIKWEGGTAPTLTASGVDVLGFYTINNGTTWRGFVMAKDSK